MPTASLALTNRELLASLRGTVPPRGLSWTHNSPPLEALRGTDARSLFLGIATNITHADPDLSPFLRELGGVPLAIELIAYRATAHSSLHDLWREWVRRGIEIAIDPDVPPGRLTSVERSIDLSLRSRRIREEGRRLFSILGRLPGGISSADCEIILGVDLMDANEQILKTGLAFHHNGRIDLLPPIRDFASRRHAPSVEDLNVGRRHYLNLVSDEGPRF